MDGKNFYVECKHSALVRCKFGNEQIDFYPTIVDRYTGMLKYSGFTQLTDTQLKALKKDSKVFNAFVKQKKLIIHNDIPASAQTPQEQLARKDKRIYELEQEIVALKQKLEVGF